MSIGTMTAKGQITIPASIREQVGLEPGSRVEFVLRPGDVIELRLLNGTAETFFNALEGFEKTAFSGSDEQAIAQTLSDNAMPGSRPTAWKQRRARGGARTKPKASAA